MAKHTLTNTTDGARGYYAGGTIVMVDAGQSAEGVELTDGELKAANDSGYFKSGVSAAQAAEPVSLTGKNKDDLLKIAADEGVSQATDKDGKTIPIADATNDEIKAAIEAKRG